MLHIGQYGDILRTLQWDLLIIQRPKDVGRGCPQDVGSGRPLAFHRGPYRDVSRTCVILPSEK